MSRYMCHGYRVIINMGLLDSMKRMIWYNSSVLFKQEVFITVAVYNENIVRFFLLLITRPRGGGGGCLFICLFVLRLNVPVKTFSVKSRWSQWVLNSNVGS